MTLTHHCCLPQYGNQSLAFDDEAEFYLTFQCWTRGKAQKSYLLTGPSLDSQQN